MNRWGYLLSGLILGLLVGWFLFGYAEIQNPKGPYGLVPQAYATTKVTICHNSGGSGNFQQISVDWTAVNGIGGGDHNSSNHQQGRDIIPPGFWDSNGRNWDAEGQAIWNNDCVVPKPSPTPTPIPPTPTPARPTPTPTPPPVCETESWSCGACQNDPREYEERLGACFEPFMDYCNKNYGCEFVGECDAKSLQECQSEWVCEDTCEEPEPTPTPPPSEEKPSGCTENCNPPAPQCTAEAVVKEPGNFHLYRRGSEAVLRWVPTGGNKVIAYWKHPTSAGWEHSTKADNTGSLTIGELGSHDWTFGLEQVNDCGGGVLSVGRLIEVVDGNTFGWVLFRP